MEPQAVRRQGPQRIGARGRAADEVFELAVPVLPEVVDVQQLLRVGVSAEPSALLDHLDGEVWPYARKGVEGGRVRAVDVGERDVDETFEPPINLVRDHEGLGEVFLAPEPASLFAVIVYGRGLFVAEAQADKLFHRGSVGVEPEALSLPAAFTHPVDHWTVGGGSADGIGILVGTGCRGAPYARACRDVLSCRGVLSSRDGRVPGLPGCGRLRHAGRDGDVYRIRTVTQRLDAQDRRPVDENCCLITYYEECEGDGPYLESGAANFLLRTLLLHILPPLSCICCGVRDARPAGDRPRRSLSRLSAPGCGNAPPLRRCCP